MITKKEGKIFTVFQRAPASSGKVGFICEADDRAEAISGVTEMIAKHYALNELCPAGIMNSKIEIDATR